MTICIAVCVLLFQKCTWWCGAIAERVCVQTTKVIHCLRQVYVKHTMSRCKEPYNQRRRLRVASGATVPGPALEGAPRFRRMSLSSYILR